MWTKKQRNGYYKAKIQEYRKRAYYILGGAKCSICGIDDIDVLSIDHIVPIGKTSRPTGTHQIYMEIIREPKSSRKKYQVLCYNCNQKKKIRNGEWKKVLARIQPEMPLEFVGEK